jgi:hypothetical protein
MANLDGRSEGPLGSVTFEYYVVPENVIGKDKDNTETCSRSAISLYYVNRMVNIGFM